MPGERTAVAEAFVTPDYVDHETYAAVVAERDELRARVAALEAHNGRMVDRLLVESENYADRARRTTSELDRRKLNAVAAALRALAGGAS